MSFACHDNLLQEPVPLGDLLGEPLLVRAPSSCCHVYLTRGSTLPGTSCGPTRIARTTPRARNAFRHRSEPVARGIARPRTKHHDPFHRSVSLGSHYCRRASLAATSAAAVVHRNAIRCIRSALARASSREAYRFASAFHDRLSHSSELRVKRVLRRNQVSERPDTREAGSRRGLLALEQGISSSASTSSAAKSSLTAPLPT